ncbi:MAG: hypothetical protein AAF224_10970 [Pseudomonadota bacterium]
MDAMSYFVARWADKQGGVASAGNFVGDGLQVTASNKATLLMQATTIKRGLQKNA